MRRLLASLSYLLPLSVVALRGAPQDPEAVAPPFRLTVSIDGVEHQVIDGVAKQIELGGKQVALRAEVAPLRHFAAAGVEFDYPRGTAFEFEDQGASRTWTLEGNDVTLMFHVMTVGTAEEMIDAILSGMARHLGDENAVAPEPCSVRFGGAEHPARLVRYSIAGSTFENIGFGVDRDGGGCTFFVLQHTLTDAGERTVECQRLLELLEHTLVIAPK